MFGASLSVPTMQLVDVASVKATGADASIVANMAFLVTELTYRLSAMSHIWDASAIRSPNFANNGHLENGFWLLSGWLALYASDVEF
jgi:hypothetical protein